MVAVQPLFITYEYILMSRLRCTIEYRFVKSREMCTINILELVVELKITPKMASSARITSAGMVVTIANEQEAIVCKLTIIVTESS